MPREKDESWAWFKAELARRLGADEAAALFAELRRRRALAFQAKQRQTAVQRIADWEEQIAHARAEGRSTARLEANIRRARALLEGGE